MAKLLPEARSDAERGSHYRIHHAGDGHCDSSDDDSILPEANIICVRPSHPNAVMCTRETQLNDEDPTAITTQCHTLELDEPLPEDFMARFGGRAENIAYFANRSPRTYIYIYISTRAGTHNAPSLLQHLLTPFLEIFGVTVRPREASHNSSTHATKITSSDQDLDPAHFIRDTAPQTFLPHAQAGHQTLLILLTGDGGVADALEAVYSNPQTADFQPPVIALIPCGTGNALANSCNILSDSTCGLSTLARGFRKPLPVMSIQLPGGSYLVDFEGEMSAADRAVLQRDGVVPARTIHAAVVFSWALHSTLVADSDTPAYRKHGAERFKMAAQALLAPPDGSGPHAFKGKLSLLGAGQNEWTTVPREEHAYLVCTLVRELERGFTISPESKATDGRMWLVHFGPHEEGAEGVMEVMGKAYDGGKHVDGETVGYEEIVGLRLEVMEEVERWRRVCVDGKIFVVPKGGVVEVKKLNEKSLLDLMVPCE